MKRQYPMRHSPQFLCFESSTPIVNGPNLYETLKRKKERRKKKSYKKWLEDFVGTFTYDNQEDLNKTPF